MPNFLVMSFEGRLMPSFDLRCLHPGHPLPDGWGVGYYPGVEPAAAVLKEPAPPTGSARSDLVRTWERVSSSVFMLHIRSARWGSITDANTQPFQRTWGGRDWLFSHSGSLRSRIELGPEPRFEPVGSTDTEAIFCQLLGQMADRGWRQLRDADPNVLRTWLDAWNQLGDLTCTLTDGSDVLVYADCNGVQEVHVGLLAPPYDEVIFGDSDLEVNLTRWGSMARKGVLIASSPLQAESKFSLERMTLAPGGLILLRDGAVVAKLDPLPRTDGNAAVSPSGPRLVGKPAAVRPRSAHPRRLEVVHRTAYTYDKPVERSSHVLRLEPIHDRLQRLVSHQLSLSVDCKWRDFDNVFGSRTRSVLIETPYQELIIESRAMVVTLDVDPLEIRPLHARTNIPLNWMPWQRHMLQPYLVPPELPESQLIELHDYAMTFVERNGFDLVDSLLDLNHSIYKDYAYRQGVTTLSTTPFEVYSERQGVCQDFTTLFICLARLLGIPARYVCGYLYTGPKHENRAMAEASHAWAQVYLPEAGWKGFDPTNGVLTQTDHIRVAVGRNYADATPTSGTLFAGGGAETLSVSVTVEEDG